MLKGSVVQVQPARHMSRNGQLRIAFHELSLPSGVEQKVEATLAGVEAGKAGNLRLDSEGGAQATTSKSRYLATAVSLSLAAVSFAGDSDAGAGGNPAGNTSNRVAGGAGGYKLIGIALGLTVHSQPFGAAMGAYGGGMSIYTHFIARGPRCGVPEEYRHGNRHRDSPAGISCPKAYRSNALTPFFLKASPIQMGAVLVHFASVIEQVAKPVFLLL